MKPTNEAGMIELLHRRYGQVYGNGPRWARAAHVKSSTGFSVGSGPLRIADYIAMHLWPGTQPGLGLVGHEIKVSRSDWLTEMRDPEKAEAFRPYVRQWYLVVSDRGIVKPGELPEGWGLMARSGRGLGVITPAPKLDPLPLPAALLGGLLRATSKTAAAIERATVERELLAGALPGGLAPA